MANSKFKAYSTLISSCFIYLILGSIFTWGDIHDYQISYLRYKGNTDIDFKSGFFFMPIALLVDKLFIFFGAQWEAKFGARLISMLGLFGIVFAYYLIYISHHIFYLYVAFGIIGISMGITYMGPLRSCFKFFPNNRGLISGMLFGSYGFSSMFLVFFASRYINPKGKPTVDHFYDITISLRMLTIGFMIVGSICIIINESAKVINAASGKSSFNEFVDESDKSDVEFATKYITNNNNNISSTNRELSKSKVNKMFEKQEKDSQEKLDQVNHNLNHNTKSTHESQPLSLAVRSTVFKQLFFMGFFTLFYPYMIINTNKTFGTLNGLNDVDLNFLEILFSGANGISRLTWGFLLDIVDFKKLYGTLLVTQILISVSIFFVVTNFPIYLILNILSAVCFGGQVVMFPPLINQIFDINNGPEMYGVIALGYGFSCILGPILSYYVINKDSDFLILYITGTVSTCVSCVILYYFKNEKFDYKAAGEDYNKEVLETKASMISEI